MVPKHAGECVALVARTPVLERILRKLAIALLAVPVLAIVYTSSALRRSFVARTGFAVGLGAMLALAVIVTVRPTQVAAIPPTVDLPLTDATFRTIVATHRGLLEPVTIEFSSPMDPRSVESAVTIDPPAPVSLRWDGTTQLLTITPTTHWAPGTLHNVTVDAGALATNGMPMVSPARATFLTRNATTGTIAVTDPIGKRVGLDSSFRFVFDGPVSPAVLQAGLTVTPPLTGEIVPAEADANGSTAFLFTPATALDPATTYEVTLSGITDAEGIAIDPVSATVKTINTPRVIRFRPVDHTTKVERDQAISVRFTRPMDRAATKAAFSVAVAGKRSRGQGLVRRERHGPRLRSSQAPAVRDGRDDDRRPDGDEQGRRADRESDQGDVPHDAQARRPSDRDRWRWRWWRRRWRRGRRRRRCRDVGCRRDLLPRAHELHAHGRDW